MRVEDPERMLFGCQVVSQHEVHFIISASSAAYRSDGIMRDSVSFSKYTNGFVAVSSPLFEYFCCQSSEPVLVSTSNSYRRHRPVQYSCIHIFKSLEGERVFRLRSLHRKLISSTLKMIVA